MINSVHIQEEHKSIRKSEDFITSDDVQKLKYTTKVLCINLSQIRNQLAENSIGIHSYKIETVQFTSDIVPKQISSWWYRDL